MLTTGVQCEPSRPPASRRGIRAIVPRPALLAAVTFLAVSLVCTAGVAAQEAESHTRTRVRSGTVQLAETFTLSNEGWSVGWTGDFRQGDTLGHSFSSRLSPTETTKVVLHAETGGRERWEAKLNQELGDLTLDLGAGSGGLFHSGIRFGARKGKGFGFAVSHVRSERRPGSTAVEIWHRIEAVGIQAALKHDRRGLSWSVTKEKVGNGALRFETLGAADGRGSSQQVIYGSRLRDDVDGLARRGTAETLQLAAEDDVFGDGAVEIDSPLLPDEAPLAWMVKDFGGRLKSIDDLGETRKIEAETVKYLTEGVWIGGQYTLENGSTEGVDAKVGSKGERLDLAVSFGYRPQAEDFVGSLQFRWRPFSADR